jgi:adenosylcobyric acid synthase
MPALTIMVQGTGSYVGKSVVTAALCRYFYKQGYRVAPFKAQNMSNNSYVTRDGGEIGRAQVFQAAACGLEPTVEMNPILLKPSSETGSQVIVLGKPVAHMRAREYHRYQSELVATLRQSFESLAANYDVVVIEGAGSPAEINLRDFDIVNMAVAKMANAPVLLVGDIHVGGVFAWLVGTLELLQPDERARIKAFIINKFRGDSSLLTGGIRFLEERTGKKTLGILPFVPDLRVDEEDGVKFPWPAVQSATASSTLRLQVIHFPRISNSTDFESFAQDPDASVEYLTRVPGASQPLPDAVILPGTKSIMADLSFLRSSGLDAYLRALRAARVPIVGICGGYQALGNRILDLETVEGSHPLDVGLGFLDVETTFQPTKKTARVRGIAISTGEEFTGYEIHMGETQRLANARPFLHITNEQDRSVDRYDGCISEDGLVWGTYVHGLFDNDSFRRSFLNRLRARRGWNPLRQQSAPSRESALDALADLVKNHLDCEMLQSILEGKL